MTPNDEKWTTGRFVTRKLPSPPITVDCSNWVDTSDGTWTTGRFEVRRRVLPPITVDCSNWGREAVTHLELLVTFDATADPDRLTEQTVAVVEGVLALAPPELGLVYERPERLPDGDVKLHLRIDGTGTDELIAELFQAVRDQLTRPVDVSPPAFAGVKSIVPALAS